MCRDERGDEMRWDAMKWEEKRSMQQLDSLPAYHRILIMNDDDDCAAVIFLQLLTMREKKHITKRTSWARFILLFLLMLLYFVDCICILYVYWSSALQLASCSWLSNHAMLCYLHVLLLNYIYIITYIDTRTHAVKGTRTHTLYANINSICSCGALPSFIFIWILLFVVVVLQNKIRKEQKMKM